MKEYEDGVLADKSKSSVNVDQVVGSDDHGNDLESKGKGGKQTESGDVDMKEVVVLGGIGFEKDKGIVMNGKESIERGLAEETQNGFGSSEVEDGVSVGLSLVVCCNTENSETEVVNQGTTAGDGWVKEKIEKDNEALKFSEPLTAMDAGSEIVDVMNEKIGIGNEGLDSEPSTTMDPSFEDVDVVVVDDPSLVGLGIDNIGEGDFTVNLDEQVAVDRSGSFHPKIEVMTEKAQHVENEVKAKDSKLAVQEVAYGNGVLDDRSGKGDDVLNSSEVLTRGEGDIGEVGQHPECPYEDAGMERRDDVLGWNEEKDESNAQCEADEEQGEPVPSGHEEEKVESGETIIVYGRRVNAVYEGMDGGIIPPILEDENLEIETDSDEEEEEEEEHKESCFSLHQSRYFHPPKNEGEFCVSDLVWGKVRSHPWWPGQIVDPCGASQKAIKYHKKNCFLVAYFGDHSFAWNDSAFLKPFRASFSQIEKQTNIEAFKNAVECALEEVTRRVELGLACSCVPHDIYKKIECQVIQNGGVRKKASVRQGSDESASVTSFEPDKLVDYVRSLAQFPNEGDKLDLAMAKAQLSSYGRYKGYREPPEFWVYQDMWEDAPIEKVHNNLTETAAYPNKDVSLSDVTDESGYVTSTPVSSSSYKKRKAPVAISNGSVKRLNRPAAPDSTPKPSFKIGEMIQRVAIQLTGPPSKASQELVGSLQKEAAIAEMLSQLHLTAQDPMKDHTFLHTIIPFFYDRRSAVFSKSLKKDSTPLSGKKRKASTEKDPEEVEVEVEVSVSERKESSENDLGEVEVGGSKAKATSANDPEEFEFVFDDINDSYWTDRIIQNPSQDQSLPNQQNGGLEYQVVPYELDNPTKKKRRHVSSMHETVKVKVESEAEKRRRENLATEVVLKFAEGIYFPSENNLNKMFRRFGPLMESETEVDKQGGRARVVFKKCCDAEIAHSSAGKFNIFGSIDVNYELNYTPLVSYKPLPLPLSQDPLDAS